MNDHERTTVADERAHPWSPVSDDPRTVVVVDAVRTPAGARNGVLAGWHAADLAAAVLGALIRRTGLDPAMIDEVILGCSSPVGDQGCNVARNAVLAAGWPESVPGTTLDGQGTSSLRALAVGADAIRAGSADVVVAGGVEVSSTTPAGAWVTPTSRPFGPAVVARYAERGGLVPPGVAAEALAEHRGLGRAELDAWAEVSRGRAVAVERARAEARWVGSGIGAVEPGRFGAEAGRVERGIAGGIVAVEVRGWDRQRRQVVPGGGRVVSGDELVAAGTIPVDPSTCKPLFVPGGRVTAANRAAAADAGAVALLMSQSRASSLGLEPMARLVASASGAVDPLTMLTGAVPATVAALARAGLDPTEVDRFEVDESFAAVTLDWMAALGVDPRRVNPDGGALARGLAPGAAGAAMLVALVHGLREHDGGIGLAALGGLGGAGAAVVIQATVETADPAPAPRVGP